MARKGLADVLIQYGLLDQGEAIVRGQGTDQSKAEHLTRLLREAGAPETITVSNLQVFRWRQALGSPPAPRELSKPADTVAKPERKPRGAPKGNRNGVGHGPPPGTKNALVTGEYETLWDEGLTERERIAMREAWTLPTLEQINRQLGLIDVRIGRALERIRQTRVVLSAGVELQLEKRVESDGMFGGTTTVKVHTREIMARQEAALDRMLQRRERLLAMRATIEIVLLKKGLGHSPAGDSRSRDEETPDLAGLSDEELIDLERLLEKTAKS